MNFNSCLSLLHKELKVSLTEFVSLVNVNNCFMKGLFKDHERGGPMCDCPSQLLLTSDSNSNENIAHYCLSGTPFCHRNTDTERVSEKGNKNQNMKEPQEQKQVRLSFLSSEKD